MELVQKYNVVTKQQENGPTTVITDQDEIKKLYGDKNYRIETNTLERKLTIKDNVLVLKKSLLVKTRREGKQFFAKKLEVWYLKVDFNTGNFITLYSFGGIKKKRQLIIRRNCFDKLEPFFDFTNGNFWEMILFRQYNLPDGTLDNPTLQNPITEFLMEKYSKSWLSQDLMGLFTRIFIQKKGIKAPDGDVDRLITRFYPTQKFLKKNNNKLVQSVLDYLGMNDSYTVKLVHKHPELDYRLLKTIHHVLGGPKYLSNVDPNVFGGYTKDFIDQGAITNDPNITKFSLRVLGQELNQLPELTDKEKGNLVKMLNDVTSFKTLNSVPYHMIVDHLNMIKQVRPYNPNIGLHSTTFRTFDREHTELSEEVSKIRKGYVVSYKFHPLMVKDIETPLGLNGEYVPYILKDENDYTEEGKYMKHCVGSYYDKDKSIIISLRNSTEFTLGGRNERWTIEFDVKNGDIIQCMGKQNSAPPTYIMDIIKNNLLRKTRTWSRTNRLKSIEKVKTLLKINGKEIDVSEYNTHDIDLPF
jgi:hypothetical protein